MSNWGVGSGTSEQRPSFSEQASEESEVVEDTEDGESQEQAEIDDYEPRYGRDAAPALSKGRYAFLPVFGFSISHTVLRRYMQENEINHRLTDEAIDEPNEVDGKELSWWKEDSITPKHQFFLINPFNVRSVDSTENSLREIYGYHRGDHFVFADSGGYQVMSLDDTEIVEESKHDPQKAQIHPESLVDWQIRNADAGASLDMPPYDITTDASGLDRVGYSDEWLELFEQRKNESAELAGRMARRLNRRREEGNELAENYLYSPVIQGKSHPKVDGELIEEWHEAVLSACEAEGVTPKGWTLSPKPAVNIGQLAAMLGHAADKLQDAEYIHALMVGGKFRKALLIYYAMLTDQFVTSDSSSHGIGSQYRKMWLPDTAIRRTIFIPNEGRSEQTVYFDNLHEAHQKGYEVKDLEAIDSKEEQREYGGRYKSTIDTGEVNPLERLPCRCQVCETVERTHGMEYITENGGSSYTAIMDLHNLVQMLQIDRVMDTLIHNCDMGIETGGNPEGNQFWRYMDSFSSENRVDDLFSAMDFVRVAYTRGIEEAYSRYTIKWVQRGGRTITRGTQSANVDFGG